MRSEKQIEASRNNGAKSNGPKSKEGKANAAKNSNRHNLTGSYLILLSTEDPVEFLHHENEYLRRFQPIDGVEGDLVRKLIAASWREKRMDVMEASILELEMQKQAPKISREFEFIGGETRQTLALLGTEDMGEAWDRLSRYQAARPAFLHQRAESAPRAPRRSLQPSAQSGPQRRKTERPRRNLPLNRK
jgi:hypothetical protein